MFFPLGLSNFGLGAWFPFDKVQSTQHLHDIDAISIQFSSNAIYTKYIEIQTFKVNGLQSLDEGFVATLLKCPT